MMKRLALCGAIMLCMLTEGWSQQAKPTQNGSITVTTGNTFQTIFPANDGRRSITIQNNNTNSDNCWITVDGGSPTVGKAMILGPGGSYQRYYPYTPREAIQGTCATTNDTIYADQQ